MDRRRRTALVGGLALLAAVVVVTPGALRSGCRIAFRRAAAEGDVPSMERWVTRLAGLGDIGRGMSEEGVVALLGDPQRTTGIYVPQGFSIGYGSADPQDESKLGEFFWLHFGPARETREKDDDPPAILVGWGA